MNSNDMDSRDLTGAFAQAKQQKSVNRDKEQERKARTHRMIVIGSTLAKYVPELNGMDDDEIRIYVSRLSKEL